ncbi:unnamed protein product [Effrenium voratum]|nr:unnamed protein product [Effrenium voratum]
MRQSAISQALQATTDQEHFARQWFERRLEMLVLMHCRLRYFAKGDAKLVAHLRRCRFQAQCLLWFLHHCTDYGSELASKEFPDEVKAYLPEPWLQLAKGPLVRFRSGIPPAYVWYPPYALGRIEWKLRQVNAVNHEKVLGHLMDACRMEAMARQQLQQLASQGALPKRPVRRATSMDMTYGVVEPHYRLHAMRMKVAFAHPEGWRMAAKMPWSFQSANKEEVVADVFKAMEELIACDKWYHGKVRYLEAKADLHFGDLENAADMVPQLCKSGGSRLDFRDFESRFDPWVMLNQRRREEEAQKLKGIFVSLRFYKALLLAVLPKNAQVVMPSPGTSLERPGTACPQLWCTCSAVHPGHRTKVQRELTQLQENRPPLWQALFKVTLALARAAMAAANAADNFRTFQSVLLMRALRDGCDALTTSGVQPGKLERPSLDWPLLSIFFHCTRCKSLRLDETQKELGKFQQSAGPSWAVAMSVAFAVARLRLHAYASAGIKDPQTGREKPRFADAKAFFESFSAQMPSVELSDEAAKPGLRSLMTDSLGSDLRREESKNSVVDCEEVEP